MSASIDSQSGTMAESSSNFTLRSMTEADLPACHRLSLQYKWPHRLDDWRFLLRLGQGIVVENRQPGKAPAIVATVVHTRYGEHHTAVGMLIVHPTLQRFGLGARLMQRVAQELGTRRQFVSATAAGQRLYEKMGFRTVDQLHQFQGSDLQPVLVPLPPGERVRPLGKSDAARIPLLDAQATGMDRSPVLAALLEQCEGVALDHEGDMLGFALIRRFGHGRVIGPVVAPDAQRAKALIAHWINTYSDSFVRIDVFESSGLDPWLGEVGLTRVDSVTRMIRGGAEVNDAASEGSGMQLFSIINQALG